jgi:hypothetical protein
MEAGVSGVRLRGLEREDGARMQWVLLGVVVLAVLFFAFTAAARLLEKPWLAPWVRIGKPVDKWGDRGTSR